MKAELRPVPSGCRFRWVRWLLVGALILAVIVTPFLAAGEAIERATEAFLTRAALRPVTAGLALAALLGSDILLPVPSSVVSTAAGFLLGPIWGTLASTAGMSLACALGFWLARLWGAPLVRRFVGGREMARLAAMQGRYADWTVIVARPLPVLAEASVLVMGMTPIRFGRFMLLSTLSNLGISAVYAGAGAWAGGANAFLPAVAASMLIPWLLMTVSRVASARGRGLKSPPCATET